MRSYHNLLKNKHAGFTDYTLYWVVFKLPFTIACCLAAILIVSQGYHLKGQSRQIDVEVFSNSLLYNQNLVFHDDLIGRTYVGNVNDEIFYYKLTDTEKSKINQYLKSLSRDEIKVNTISYDFLLSLNASMSITDRNSKSGVTYDTYRIIEPAIKVIRERQNNLAKSISFRAGVNYIVGNITLIDYSGNQPMYYSIYYNEEKYRELSVYVGAEFTEGEGGFKLYKHVYPILVGRNKKAGFLVTELIIPNPAGSGIFA